MTDTNPARVLRHALTRYGREIDAVTDHWLERMEAWCDEVVTPDQLARFNPLPPSPNDD